jgi:hypothetical protein
MNFDKSQNDRTREGFEGSINLSRIDRSVLKIKFDNLYSKICIYGLGSNVLRTLSGMCGLAFTGSNICHDYCDYQENGIYRSNMIDSVPNYNIIYKLITDNDKTNCCITYEGFGVNARYMNCVQCHNNFNEDSIKQWFSQRIYQKTCPMCRVNWIDFNVYINGSEPSGEVDDC